MPQPVDLPRLEVELLGYDGNALSIIGTCTRTMRRNKYPKDVIDEFVNEALDGDYDHVLRTVMDWFDVV